MQLEEYVKLTEVTEKKFPNGLSIPYATSEALFNKLREFANDKTLDNLKKEIFYKDHVVNESQSYVHFKEDYAEVLHAVVGMVTEVQEIAQWLLNGATDMVNLQEEIIDWHWYESILIRKGVNIEEGREKNINKLKARYGEKFSNHAALNRDLKTERKILEGSDD